MSESIKPPYLRIVGPDEKAQEAPNPAPNLTSPHTNVSVEETSEAATEFSKAVDDVNAAVPISAAYLVCAGCYVADAALSTYKQAAAYAPGGTFHNDTPPGSRAAEASRAWLGDHLQQIKKKAAEEYASTRPYDRASDLKEAAKMAATELDRAIAAAKIAGLKLGKRRDYLLEDARSSIVALPKEIVKPEDATAIYAEDDLYIFGAYVLGAVR